MDREVVQALQHADIDTTFEKRVPGIGIEVRGDGSVVPIDDPVGVVCGDRVAMFPLKKAADLWDRRREASDFARGPTPEYLFFFTTIEMTAADYCSCAGTLVRDQEFERLYNHLRRRPDGTDANPLFSYLQAAARLYMSLRDVSQAEFEAVARRLTKSARTFSEGVSSTNYADLVLDPLLA